MMLSVPPGTHLQVQWPPFYPQAPSTQIICHPIAELVQQCHNLPPNHLPNLQEILFSS